MELKILFDRFEIDSVIMDDDVFCYYKAKNNKDNHKTVLLAHLKLPWRNDKTVVDELTDYFRQLQGVRSREISSILQIAQNAQDGLGVALEWPTGTNLHDFDKKVSVNAAKFIGDVCEAMHKINVKGLFHVHLRKQDIWVDGDKLKITGFGYTPLLSHGWKSNYIELSPEVASGKHPDTASEVYSVARLIAECFPDLANDPATKKALEKSPDSRYKKVREFQNELLGSWSPEEIVNIKPDKKRKRSGVRLLDPTREVRDVDVEKSIPSVRSEKKTEETKKSVVLPAHTEHVRDSNYYFSESQFLAGYNYTILYSKINTVYFGNKLDTSINSIEHLNRTLEMPDFYHLWLEQGALVKFNKDIEKLQKSTRSYRDKKFSQLSKKQKNTIVLFNRTLIEITYPKLCPKVERKEEKPKTKRKHFVYVAIAAVLILGMGVKIYIDNTVFNNELVPVKVGRYQITPFHKRFLPKKLIQSVRIYEPFSIQIGEVTVGEFKQFYNSLDKQSKTLIGENWKQDIHGELYPNNRPVDYISARDAGSYAAWLSKKTGQKFQLPSYDQWVAAIIIYGESSPILKAKDSVTKLRSKPDHLIGNHREWSSHSCDNNKYVALGEDYMTQNTGEFPCFSDTDKYKGLGFRLVRIEH